MKGLMQKLRFVLLLPLICLAPVMERAQAPAQTAEGMLAPVNRFEGSAQFKGKGGRPRDVRVTIRQLTIPGKQKIDALAERGFLLVTVRAGKVTTTIAGKQEQHRTDDFWTVPENAKMSVEAAGEAALLEVVAFTIR